MSDSTPVADSPAPTANRLDEDIKRLSGLLDNAVRELAGDAGYALVERIRDAAGELRARDGQADADAARDRFAALFEALDLDQLELLARVFTLWFHLVNCAEEQHRIRILRGRDQPDSAPDGSIAHGFQALKDAGLTADDVRDLLKRLFVMPVLTAHPTEARRRTVLDHLTDIGRALDALDRTALGDRERARVIDSLRNTIIALLGTVESRATKPSPRDEIASGLDVFETSLLDVTPAVYRALDAALATCYPAETFAVPPFLRWGTWIGGDRDGNPFVTADTTRAAFERHRVLVLQRYLADVEHLIRELSISDGRSAVRGDELADLRTSLAADRARLPEVAARAEPYTAGEPWRKKLWYMRARLTATLTRQEAAYTGVAAYLADLTLLRDSLRAAGFARLADARLRDAIRRAEVFGFHLASLDVRQHSDVHERAVTELLAADGIVAPGDVAYSELDEHQRVTLLTGLLEGATSLRRGSAFETAALSAETRELLATLDMVGRARREQGALACERYIVSFTREVSDLLEVLYLIRAARLSPGELRPVPLLEQLEDLDRAAAIAAAMLASGPIRAAIGDELEIMIGYSDAGKQIGYFASAVALRRAQLAVAEVAAREGVALTIFHGRGGAIGRGGGPASRSIRAQPPRAVRGRIRVTEQGETITTRYARAEIASRDLEQVINAVLLSTADEKILLAGDELAARNASFDHAATSAEHTYRDLLADPDRLARYVLAATPIRQVTRLPIGSRPASRKPGLSFDDLRAIPWVFSWNQSRHGVPGWFGLGAALEALIARDGVEPARDLYRDSPFFRALLNNAQLAMRRADIHVARHYARLADDRDLFGRIEAEFSRTATGVEQIVSSHSSLGIPPHLVEVIRRRNPFVDILSHAQIELLRRLDQAGTAEQIDPIRKILFITINGIAAGLQTAG